MLLANHVHSPVQTFVSYRLFPFGVRRLAGAPHASFACGVLEIIDDRHHIGTFAGWPTQIVLGLPAPCAKALPNFPKHATN